MSEKKMVKNKKVANFKVNLKQAIEYYLKLTKPMHKLSNKQILLLTEIIYMYTSERENFVREEDTWKKVFSSDNRYLIRTSLDVTKQVFENYLTQFRKKKVIINNTVNPVYNPFVFKDIKEYELVFKFHINE